MIDVCNEASGIKSVNDALIKIFVVVTLAVGLIRTPPYPSKLPPTVRTGQCVSTSSRFM